MKYIFSSGTVITHFLHKCYQEKNYLVNKKKYCQFCACPVWIYFTLLDCVHFTMRLKSFNYKSHWNILVLFEYAPHKNAGFCFNCIIPVHLSHNTEKFWFWDIIIVFHKERCGVRFFWFCFISIVWFHFSHKTEKFRF